MISTWATEQTPCRSFSAGTRVTFGNIHGWKDDGSGLTGNICPVIVLKEETFIWDAIEKLEKEALEELKVLGCSFLRDYFIEGYDEANGIVEIILGT